MARFNYRRPTRETIREHANQSGGNREGYILDQYTLYSPHKGENCIRILPQEDADHYAMELFVHYSVGPDNASVLCPLAMWEKKCPICEARVRADRRQDEDLAKELRPKKRALVWLLDRLENRKGPMLWAMPWTVDKDISKISEDRSTREFYAIDDPEEGYDVTFDKEGERDRTKYDGFQIARRSSQVDQDHLDYVAEHPMKDCLRERDYDEILKLFEGGEDDGAGSDRRRSRDRDEPEDRDRRGSRDRDRDNERDPESRNSSRRDRERDQREPDARDRRSSRDRDADDPADRRGSRDRDEPEDRDRRGSRDRDRDNEREPEERGSRRSRDRDADEPEDRGRGSRDRDRGRDRDRDADEPEDRGNRRSHAAEDDPAPRTERRRLTANAGESRSRRDGDLRDDLNDEIPFNGRGGKNDRESSPQEDAATRGRSRAQELAERYGSRKAG